MSVPDRANNPKRTYVQALSSYEKTVGPLLGKRTTELNEKLGRPVTKAEIDSIREDIHKETGQSKPKREDY